MTATPAIGREIADKIQAQLNHPTDREIYEFCQQEMEAAKEAGDWERFNLYWAELESVKNKHGGFPPK